MSADQIISNPIILEELGTALTPHLQTNMFNKTFSLVPPSAQNVEILNEHVPVSAGKNFLILVSFQTSGGLTSAGFAICTVTINGVALPSLTAPCSFGTEPQPSYNFFTFMGTTTVSNPLINIVVSTEILFNISSGLATISIIQ